MMMETTTKEEGLGFEITELRLGLPGAATTTTTTTGSGPSGSTVTVEKPDKKRSFSEFLDDENSSSTDWKNHNKNQIVGWPPVCSYRKKNINVHLLEKNGSENTKMYVKIAMDGAPYLRKIDLSAYEDYSDLAVAFEKLFGCFGIGGVWKDCDSSEYIPIYEDKDHDWMLVGDVPWKMFVESCKRLRIMKRSDAKGFGLQSKNSDKV